MDKRTLLAVVLSLAVLMGYQYFFQKPLPRTPGEPVQNAGETAGKTENIPQEITGDQSTHATPIIDRRKSLTKKDEDKGTGKDIIVEGPMYTAIFSSKGASLKSFKLNGYRKDMSKDSVLVELVNVGGSTDYPLTTTFPESSIDIPTDVIYESNLDSVDFTDDMGGKDLVFSWSYPGEVRVEKIYTFYPDKYSFDLEVRLTNLSDDTFRENALIEWNRYVDPSEKTDRYSHEGPISYVKDKVVSEKVKKLGAREFSGPDVSWGGFETKYFIAAMIPEQPSLTNFIVSKDSRDMVFTALEGPKNIIPPSQSGSFRYTLYIGPKKYNNLHAQDVNLEDSIDFGSWVKWLALPLLKALNWIDKYVHNYGAAIIILTILVKLIFWPLGNISYKSMKGMQKLQPQMKKLQEKYKDDKAKLQKETMALYKSNKVNPMSGCFPMLIQLPVFFGLYRALLYSIELRHAPFIFWIQDLSAKDPYYITPIVMGATMFLQQKMSPAPGGNEMQAKMMMWMPVVFTFLFLNFPSGLVIYWLFNNILSIGQQYYINKKAS
ncbi:MAG: membrane protein insertase YidC [Deltaproteobacteria bacterium]|nr:membrane protein insertase YidC [Deltaproteobacteria bacterium]MBW2650818.1 membrane protein insertase YidC [Deltaproteobacteria bacterium]